VIYRGPCRTSKGRLDQHDGRVLPSAVKAQVDTPELPDLQSESSGFLLAPSKLLFHSRSLIVAREQIRENGLPRPGLAKRSSPTYRLPIDMRAPTWPGWAARAWRAAAISVSWRA
jgi:hypothetical protein